MARREGPSWRSLSGDWNPTRWMQWIGTLEPKRIRGLGVLEGLGFRVLGLGLGFRGL